MTNNVVGLAVPTFYCFKQFGKFSNSDRVKKFTVDNFLPPPSTRKLGAALAIGGSVTEILFVVTSTRLAGVLTMPSILGASVICWSINKEIYYLRT